MAVAPESVAEVNLSHQYTTKDKNWAMYCGYLKNEDNWLKPTDEEEFFAMDLEDMSRWGLVKSRFRHFIENLNMDGPVFVLGYRHPLRRVLWLLFFLFSCGLCVQQSYLLFEDYLSYPKLVNIEMVTESVSSFPAVTLCNLNPLNVKDEVKTDPYYGGFVQIQEENENPKCENLTDVRQDPLDAGLCYGFTGSCPVIPPLSPVAFLDDGLAAALSIIGAFPLLSSLNISLPLPLAPSLLPSLNTSLLPSLNTSLLPSLVGAPSVSNMTTLAFTTLAAPVVLVGRKKREAEAEATSDVSGVDIFAADEGVGGRGLWNSLGTLDTQHKHIHSRQKRQAPVQTNTSMPITTAAARIRCSFTYQYLTVQAVAAGQLKAGLGYTLDDNGVTYGDTTSCGMQWDGTQETVRYCLPCHTNVYCDQLGCYVNATNVYTSQTLSNGSVVPSCLGYAVSANAVFLLENNTQVNKDNIKTMIRNSRTNDLSDVVYLYGPDLRQTQEYGRPAHEFVQLCSFDMQHCSYRVFTPLPTKEFGMCYTFNSPFLTPEGSEPINITTRRSTFQGRPTHNVGPQSGLRLTLSLEVPEYVSLLSPDAGLRMLLHDPWEAPFPSGAGFNLAPGMTHSVSISRTFLNRVGDPYGSCSSDQSGQYDYSRTLCAQLCLERLFRQKCGCMVSQGDAFDSLDSEADISDVTRLCDVFVVKDATCLAAARSLYNSDSFDCGCVDSCTETVYKPLVTSSQVNPKFVTIAQNSRNVNGGNDVCGGWSNSTIRLNIYLASSPVEVITETPVYTIVTFVANFGGQVGLFIGISLISMLDILYFIMDVIFILISPSFFVWTREWPPQNRKVDPEHKTGDKKVFILAGPPDWLPHGE